MANFLASLKSWNRILGSPIIVRIVSHHLWVYILSGIRIMTTFTSSISINKSRDIPKSTTNFTYTWGDKLLMANNKKVLLTVALRLFVNRPF